MNETAFMGITNTEKFMGITNKEKLFKNYIEKCTNDIQDSEYYPKLRTYKIFKLNFKQEIYLSEIIDSRYIIALARFRNGLHILKIET